MNSVDLEKINEDLKHIIDIQDFLYQENCNLSFLNDFFDISCVQEIIRYIRNRPFDIIDIIKNCINHKEKQTLFLQYLIHYSIKHLPIVAYYILEFGGCTVDDINRELEELETLFPLIYFFDSLPNFHVLSKKFHIGHDFQILFSNEPENLKSLIKNGFRKESLGYSLKYDDLNGLKDLYNDSKYVIDSLVSWTDFEWSYCPKNHTSLVVSAHFGSIKCFKFLILNKAKISPSVIPQAIYSGCFELIHITQEYFNCSFKWLKYASEFFQERIFNWIVENGIVIHNVMSNTDHLRSLLFFIQNGGNIFIKDKFLSSIIMHELNFWEFSNS